MNEAALDAELSLPQYAAMTDQQAADAITLKTVTVRRPVDSGLLMDAAMALGIWERLESAAPPGSVDPPAAYARTMMTRLKETRPVDLDNAAVSTLVQNCIQHGRVSGERSTDHQRNGRHGYPVG